MHPRTRAQPGTRVYPGLGYTRDPGTLCYAIVLPGRKSAFRARFWTDCYREGTEICRPNSGREGRFPARKHYCATTTMFRKSRCACGSGPIRGPGFTQDAGAPRTRVQPGTRVYPGLGYTPPRLRGSRVSVCACRRPAWGRLLMRPRRLAWVHPGPGYTVDPGASGFRVKLGPGYTLGPVTSGIRAHRHGENAGPGLCPGSG